MKLAELLEQLDSTRLIRINAKKHRAKGLKNLVRVVSRRHNPREDDTPSADSDGEGDMSGDALDYRPQPM